MQRHGLARDIAQPKKERNRRHSSHATSLYVEGQRFVSSVLAVCKYPIVK